MNLYILGVLLIGNEAQPQSPAYRTNGRAEIKIQAPNCRLGVMITTVRWCLRGDSFSH